MINGRLRQLYDLFLAEMKIKDTPKNKIPKAELMPFITEEDLEKHSRHIRNAHNAGVDSQVIIDSIKELEYKTYIYLLEDEYQTFHRNILGELIENNIEICLFDEKEKIKDYKNEYVIFC